MNNSSPAQLPILHLPGIHFKDGHKIFCIDENQYFKFERGLKRLAHRALLIAGLNDNLILDTLPDPDYLTFLHECGVGGKAIFFPEVANGSSLCEDVLNSPACLKHIRDWEYEIEPYMFTNLEQEIRDCTDAVGLYGDAIITELLNDKVFFFRLTEDLGLPQPKTLIGSKDSIAIKILTWEATNPIIVRANTSIGGSRVWSASTPDERRTVSKEVERNLDQMFLMQTLEDVTFSPNLQYRVCDKEICVVGRTIQILDNCFEHSGNIFDGVEDLSIASNLDKQGRVLALEAAHMGYRGLLGVDFIVTQAGDVYAVELNARYNSSTYALSFCNRVLNGDPLKAVESGLCGYLRLKTGRILTGMQWINRLGDLAYNPSTKRGALPYDCESEYLELVIIGNDSNDRDQIIEQLKALTA
ncbi:MAG TPA: hypothetical protein QF720_08475 [Nitrospinota bacterium]|nr:hypothetical protein [Nitrospinota bacterium]